MLIIDKLLPVAVHPKNVTIPIGRNVTFTCKASISGSLVYTWERRYAKKWTLISSHNSTTYTTVNFGQYRCKVHDGTKTTVSETAVVVVHSRGVCTVV